MSTSNGVVPIARPGRAANVALWTLQVLLAVAFLAAGCSKLAGAPMMVETFEKVGLGQWFRYVTGVLEIVAAIALLVPRRNVLGAILLIPIMIGAALAHVFVMKDNPAPPLVLLALALIVAWGRRGQVAQTPGIAPREAAV